MSPLRLSFACCRYDRTEAIREGTVQVEGVDLACLTFKAGREIFDRMVGGREFDISELSASEYISLVGRGDCGTCADDLLATAAARVRIRARRSPHCLAVPRRGAFFDHLVRIAEAIQPRIAVFQGSCRVVSPTRPPRVLRKHFHDAVTGAFGTGSDRIQKLALNQ